MVGRISVTVLGGGGGGGGGEGGFCGEGRVWLGDRYRVMGNNGGEVLEGGRGVLFHTTHKYNPYCGIGNLFVLCTYACVVILYSVVVAKFPFDQAIIVLKFFFLTEKGGVVFLRVD